MSNSIKDIEVKNCMCYFFDDIISIKNLEQNNIKTDEKSHKNISIYYNRYVTIKDLKCVKINGVNRLYLFFNIVFEDINRNM